METTPEQMKRNLVLAGILLIGAGLVTVGVLFRPGAKPKAVEPERAAMVEIDDNAFEPAELTVKKGTKVTWRVSGNDEDGYVLKANDGVDLPGFGSSEFKGATTYSFKFDKSGTFNYHNANIPTGNGLVRVVD